MYYFHDIHSCDEFKDLFKLKFRVNSILSYFSKALKDKKLGQCQSLKDLYIDIKGSLLQGKRLVKAHSQNLSLCSISLVEAALGNSRKFTVEWAS